ncbi:MAG: hypothetical protein ACI4TL_01965 [Candidatus Cryptobacteroides sp.]
MTEMRSGIRHIAFLAGLMTVLLPLSCTRIERLEPASPLICYNVVQFSQTKAAGLYPTSESFISFAFLLADDKTWAANHSEATAYIENATISFDGSRWKDASKSYYWPMRGKLNFLSYSPDDIRAYATVNCANGITISDWDVNARQDVDIMVADVQTEQTTNRNLGLYTGVPTIFRHKLSQIVGFEFNTFEDYAHGHDGSAANSYQAEDRVFIVNSIEIGNIVQKGSYYSSYDVGSAAAKVGAWVPDSGAATSSYTWYNSAEGTKVKYSTGELTSVGSELAYPYIMLLPQIFTDPGSAEPSTVEYLRLAYTIRTYSSESSYSEQQKTAYVSLYDVFSSSSNRINLNRQIKVRITFNLQADLITWAPDQEEWSDSEFSLII